MATHLFTLVLGADVPFNDDVAEQVCAEVGDDTLLGMCNTAAYIDFRREADSFGSALLSAIRDVEGIGLRVEHVEPGDYVSQAEIARRLDKSREYIRQLVSGESGPEGFPPPVSNVTDRSPRWRWSDVAKWLVRQGMLPADELKRASFIALVNTYLDCRRLGLLPEEYDIVSVLESAHLPIVKPFHDDSTDATLRSDVVASIFIFPGVLQSRITPKLQAHTSVTMGPRAFLRCF